MCTVFKHLFWKKYIQNVQCIRKGRLVDLTLFATEFQQLKRTWRVVSSILAWRSGIIFWAFGSSNSLFFNYETILNRHHASFYFVYLPTKFFLLISYDNQSNIFSIILIIASLKYLHQWLITINGLYTTTWMVLCFIAQRRVEQRERPSIKPGGFTHLSFAKSIWHGEDCRIWAGWCSNLGSGLQNIEKRGSVCSWRMWKSKTAKKPAWGAGHTAAGRCKYGEIWLGNF